MSPDSFTAASLLSAMTMAFCMTSSSNSLQSGRQAPTPINNKISPKMIWQQNAFLAKINSAPTADYSSRLQPSSTHHRLCGHSDCYHDISILQGFFQRVYHFDLITSYIFSTSAKKDSQNLQQIDGCFICLLNSFCLGSSPDAYFTEFVTCPQGVHMAPSLHTAANDTQHRGRTGNKSLNKAQKIQGKRVVDEQLKANLDGSCRSSRCSHGSQLRSIDQL